MKQITCPHCGDTYPDFDVAHVCSKGPYAPRLKPKMNERIRELAEQAGLKWKAQPPHYTNTNNPIDFPVSANRDLEKFAELIVRECANIADEYDGAGSTIVSRIKKHFEVEE